MKGDFIPKFIEAIIETGKDIHDMWNPNSHLNPITCKIKVWKKLKKVLASFKKREK